MNYRLKTIFNKQNRRTLYCGLGYQSEHMNFTASNLHQWYPADPTKPDIYVNDKVINYQILSRLPFWKWGMIQTIDAVTLDLSYTASPYIIISDRDDHLLRAKLAEGELTGDYSAWRTAVRYSMANNWSWNLGYEYQKMQANGRQKQSRYKNTSEGPAQFIAKLDEKIVAEQQKITFYLSDKYINRYSDNTKQDQKNDNNFVAGVAYLYPMQERETSIGPHLEFDTKHYTIGIAYHHGNNKVQTISKGIYNYIPVYCLLKWNLIDSIKLLAGGGYAINYNKTDPHVSSYLQTKGYSGAKESLSSAGLYMAGLEIADPWSKETISYAFVYSIQEPMLTFNSDSYENKKRITLSTVQLILRVKI